MSPREALDLIFLPGLSTAEAVTNVSGRGVGMDVVKTNIEKIGGSIDLQSPPGQGTTLKIKIPLTLAIIPALVVECAGERFAIPQVNLVELVRLESGQEGQQQIELIRDTPVYRLRGKLLPLVYLSDVLGLQGTHETNESVNIIVVQADQKTFGLVVDGVHDTAEIVVKPLSKLLKRLNCYAGATIMGDGHVALILDVMGLAQLGRVVGESSAHGQPTNDRLPDGVAERQAVLLFRVGTKERLAVPLVLVDRLEEFGSEAIELSGERKVVQYRGRILPLVPLESYLGGPADIRADTAPSSVFDGYFEKTFVPDQMLTGLSRLINAEEELGFGSDRWVETLDRESTSAIRQVFGMMTGTEPEAVNNAEAGDPVATSYLT